MTRSRNIFLAVAATLGMGLIGALSGCGGGGSNNGGSNGGTQANSYAEAVMFANGQSGALSVSASGSAASGTFAIGPTSVENSVRPHTASAHVVSTVVALPAGVYPVTGTLASGVFTLIGTISGTAFTLTVTLPSGTASGSLSLTIGTGSTATTYTGSITSVPTGTSADSAIAGTYQVTGLGNTTTDQTVTCPGTLAFGNNDPDTCDGAAFFILNANGTLSISEAGSTAYAGSYTLIGNLLTVTTQQSGSGQTLIDLFSVAPGTGANTSVWTRLSTTDSTNQAQIGEEFFLTKTSSSGSGTTFPYAGTYTDNTASIGSDGTITGTGTATFNANGTVQFSSSGSDVVTGTATVNGSGQVLLSAAVVSGPDVGLTYSETLTVSGTAGNYTLSGGGTDSQGHTLTFTAAENAATTNNIYAGTYTGVSSSDPSYGYDAAITNFTVTNSGAVTGSVNEGNVIGTVSGSVNSVGAITASGGSTQDTYTFTGTFQTVNGVREATGTYTSSGQTLPGHWVVVQSVSTGVDSQIAGAYAGTVTGTVTSSGTSGSGGTIINANGTATVADTAGDVGIGSVTLNGSGQVVLTVTNPNNGGVVTFTGTISGTAGSQVYAGNVTDNGGGSGTFDFTQFNPAQTSARGNARRL